MSLVSSLPDRRSVAFLAMVLSLVLVTTLGSMMLLGLPLALLALVVGMQIIIWIYRWWARA